VLANCPDGNDCNGCTDDLCLPNPRAGPWSGPASWSGVCSSNLGQFPPGFVNFSTGNLQINPCFTDVDPCQIYQHERDHLQNGGDGQLCPPQSSVQNSPCLGCIASACEAHANEAELDCCPPDGCVTTYPCQALRGWCSIYNDPTKCPVSCQSQTGNSVCSQSNINSLCPPLTTGTTAPAVNPPTTTTTGDDDEGGCYDDPQSDKKREIACANWYETDPGFYY